MVDGLKDAVARATRNGATTPIMVARRGPAQREELLIGAVAVHPGYPKWRAAMNLQVARAAGGAHAVSLIAPCDVALLEVTHGDPGKPLPLAESEGGPLVPRVGEPVAYLGFPMENVAGLPSLQIPAGRITAVTDFFFRTADPDQALLLHYDAVTTGGSSGSPLLNSAGAVIGMVSASSMGESARGGRIPVGINYAQRVDLVRELLDGTAEGAQLKREGEWHERMRTAFLGPKDMIGDVIRASLARRGSPPADTVADIDFVVGAGKQGSFRTRVSAEPGFDYGFCAAASDWSGIALGVFQGTVCLASGDTGSVPMLWLDAHTLQRDADVVIYAQATRMDHPAGVLRVVRVKR